VISCCNFDVQPTTPAPICVLFREGENTPVIGQLDIVGVIPVLEVIPTTMIVNCPIGRGCGARTGAGSREPSCRMTIRVPCARQTARLALAARPCLLQSVGEQCACTGTKRGGSLPVPLRFRSEVAAFEHAIGHGIADFGTVMPAAGDPATQPIHTILGQKGFVGPGIRVEDEGGTVVRFMPAMIHSASCE
jgi:hypothetical protein